MAFAIPPTLAEVRKSTAILLNFGAQAAQAGSLRELLDEFIRQAARDVALEFPHAELRFREDIDLIDGQSIYDWPDNLDPGRLERVTVVTDSNKEYALRSDIQPHERSMWTQGDDPRSAPVRYEIINQDLNILPAPDTETYKTLRIEGYARDISPTHNDDKIPVDKQALILMSVAYGKAHFQHADALAAAQKAKEYIKRLRPMVSEGAVFRIGGHFSTKFPYRQRRNSGDGAGENYWLYP